MGAIFLKPFRKSKQSGVLLADYSNRKLLGKFYITSEGYVAINGTYLHRKIIKAKKGEIVDHINGNPLDNRRKNLRICTKAQNGQNRKALNKNNRSGHRGVWFSNTCQKWIAAIRVVRKRIHLGVFKTKEAAADAYKNAAEQYFGDFVGRV